MKNLIKRIIKEEVSTNRDLLNLYNVLVNNKIVDPQHINEYSDNFEIYGIQNKMFPYFIDNYIIVRVYGDHILLDYVYYEEDIDDAEEVSEYLTNVIYDLYDNEDISVENNI